MDEKPAKGKISSTLSSFGTFVWNSKTREFLGRDGLSWAKISLFYGIFYTALAAFFIGMLAIFVGTLDFQKPTYFDKTSTMNVAKDGNNRKNGINPGMGFRPQIDVESASIAYSLTPNDEDGLKYARSLKIYLENKYTNSTASIKNCQNYQRDVSDVVRDSFTAGRYCKFDYEGLLEKTGYTALNNYGFLDNGPLMLLKVNRIYDWKPEAYSPSSLPDALSSIREKLDEKMKIEFDEILRSNIIIKCRGENSADEDVVNNLIINYFSIDDRVTQNFNNTFGAIPFYFYPYLNQNGYEAPLVFTKFDFKNSNNPNKFITRGVVTNVICQAYAGNIDSSDKLNLRGMTQFQLFVK